MDSYPNNNPDDERSYPAAPKGGSSGPDGVPLGPDHNPPSGGYQPNDESWAGGAAFPLSSPYTGMSSGEPPAPIFRPEIDSPGVARGGFPSRTDVGARSKPTNRRRVLAGLAAFLLLVLVVGGLAFVLLGGGGTGHPTANGGNTNNGGGAPVIVGTDTPIPTPTLLPGQTPLPTALPATATPVRIPGQPTPTPIPYGSSASVSFTRATQGYSVPSTLTAATSGGDIPAIQESASDVPATVTESQDQFAAQPASYMLTVTNNANFQATSSGATIVSTGGIGCVLQGSLTINAHTTSSTKQACFTNPGAQPDGVSFNDSTHNSPFVYVGGPFPPQGSEEYWQVPADCTTRTQFMTDAQNKDKTLIQPSLASQVPGGSSVFSGPSYYNFSALACSPVAGTQTFTSTPQTLTVSISGSGTQTSYKPGDAIGFQQNRVKNSAGSGYQYISANVCSSPSLSNASATSVTVTCSASGTEAWNVFNLPGMAALIHGQTQATAKGELDAVQGVVAGSETFSVSGGSYLPTNANNISFHYSP